MTEALSLSAPGRVRAGLTDELLATIGGLGFTLALFTMIGSFEGGDAPPAPMDIEDLRQVAIPLDPPPPKVIEQTQPAEMPMPFAGLDIAASDSPVKIAVVPPDLSDLVPASDVPPTATIEPAMLYSGFKPKMEIGADFNRVYQQTEVDRKPAREITPNPSISSRVRGNADRLQVRLLMIIDQHGKASGVRVTRSSGNPEFDRIVAECVRDEWVFSPAIKNGRKVKCLVEQPFTVVWSGGSRFSP